MYSIRSLILLLVLTIPADAVAAEPVTLQLVDLTGIGLTRDGIEFELLGQVERSGGPAVVLRELNYTIYLGEEAMGQGSAEIDRLKIRSGAPQKIALPCTLSLSSGAHAIMSSLMTGEIDLWVEGEVRYRVLFFPRTYSFVAPLLGPS